MPRLLPRICLSARTTGGLAVGTSLGAVAVSAWLLVKYPGLLVSNVLNRDPASHVDFETFYRSAVALLHRTDIYQTGAQWPNLNPPVLTLLLTPFGLAPPVPAYAVFTGASLAVMTVAVLLVARELELRRRWQWTAVLTLWISSPLHGTLVLGQIYGLLLLGLTLAWLAQRHGRPLRAAMILGVVVAIKPSLGPVLLIPLVQRQWRALWVGLLSAGLCTVIGVLAAGPDSAVGWLRLATGTPATERDANASLPGLVARLGGSSLVGWLLTAVVVAGSLWWVRAVATAPAPGGDRTAKATPAPGGGRTAPVRPVDATLFAVVAGSVLAAPIAWLNYTVLLWPGALVLVAAGRWRVGVPLMVVPMIPVAWDNLWRTDPHTLAALCGRSLYCAVLVGYWVALLRFAASAGRDPDTSDGAPGTASLAAGDRTGVDAGPPSATAPSSGPDDRRSPVPGLAT